MAGAAVISDTRSTSETRSTKGAATRDQILNAAARLIHVPGLPVQPRWTTCSGRAGSARAISTTTFKSKEDMGYAIHRSHHPGIRRAQPGTGLRGYRPRIR